MRLSPAVTFALTVLLVMAALGTVAVASSAPAPATSGDSASPAQSVTTIDSVESGAETSQLHQIQEPLPPANPEQIIRLNVSSDGDVRWTIESRFLLSDEDDIDAFEDHAEAVRRGERDVGYDAQTFEPYVSEAEASTGREMAIEDAGWEEPELRTPEQRDLDEDAADDEDDETRIGVLAYSFTWTNFTTVDDDRIHFGDAFETTDESTETWLPLYEGQRLVIESPQNYALETPTSLSWDGPYQFEASELQIVFVRGATSTPTPPGPGGSSWTPILLAGVVLVAGVGGYLAYRYAKAGKLDELPLDRLPVLGGKFAESRSDTARTPAMGDPSDSPAESADAGAGTPTHEAGSQFEYEEDRTEDVDPELLSDEERVHRLLKQNGGRMKQGTIVKETGWSNAKVSQLLSKMDDDGEIEKLRIGRENLITLPEVDPTEID